MRYKYFHITITRGVIMNKFIIFGVLCSLAAAPAAFAEESVLKHCEGWIPSYFVDLVKIQNADSVEYQVNFQGKVKNFKSLALAQVAFDEGCELVKSWE